MTLNPMMECVVFFFLALIIISCQIQNEDWTEEEKLNQGFKEDEFAFLSDMIGPKGMAFDNDEVLDDNDDEDLKNDPVSQLDMQVSNKPNLGFSAIVD
jgi:hypothetical protein